MIAFYLKYSYASYPKNWYEDLDHMKPSFADINTGLLISLDDFAQTVFQRSVEDLWCLFEEKATCLICAHIPFRT